MKENRRGKESKREEDRSSAPNCARPTPQSDGKHIPHSRSGSPTLPSTPHGLLCVYSIDLFYERRSRFFVLARLFYHNAGPASLLFALFIV